MEIKVLNVIELALTEKREITGGNPILIFIAGAICGGIVYDIYKAACLALIKAQMEHPEYYDGPVHSQM
jgi:uncharacterized membrane protein YoaK (UPF0700 family)